MSARFEHIGRGDAFDDAPSSAPDREISLGTTTVLAIFVGLALVCGAFFGFGYSIGRKSMLPTLGNVDTRVSASPAASAVAPESDAAASDATVPATVVKQGTGRSIAPDTDTPVEPGKRTVQKPAATSDLASGASRDTSSRAAASPATDGVSTSPRVTTAPKSSPAPVKPSPASSASATPVPAPSALPAAATGSQSYVQVAAISHKEDADLLLASLHRRGYTASIRQVPQDNLLHIQIGPLAGKKEAEQMRQRLLSDGYNAIVK